MRKSIITALVGLFVIALTSCQDRVQQVSGTYSYKISGQVVANYITHTLTDEEGAMEMIRQDSTTALVTFNALRGHAYVTTAEIHADSIVLQPYERILTVESTDYAITAFGKGKIYDNTILISLTYKGNRLSGENVTLLCKKN